MSKLSLPNITLVMMDTTCPELAKLAVEDSLGVADFGDVVVFSDKTWMDGPRFIKAQPWRSPDEYNHYFWYEVPKYLTTEWAIFIQWDSWLLDASQWADEFLQYDYIGAPWWYFDHLNVGNGCGLRSTRLMRFLANRKNTFPLTIREEDHLLSRIYRPQLEAHGFKWAPNHLASQFSFECTRPAPDSKHFMFHGSFNFPFVLNGDRLEIRLRLAKENAYLQSGDKLYELLEAKRLPFIMPVLASHEVPVNPGL